MSSVYLEILRHILNLGGIFSLDEQIFNEYDLMMEKVLFLIPCFSFIKMKFSEFSIKPYIFKRDSFETTISQFVHTLPTYSGIKGAVLKDKCPQFNK